jgi:hypothetical protein
MKNLTPELIAQARVAKTAEELLELAGENNVEITAEEAKTYFEQLHVNSAVSDDELDTVAGGSDGGCGSDEDADEQVDEKAEEDVKSINARPCPKCHAQTSIPVGAAKRECLICGYRF